MKSEYRSCLWIRTKTHRLTKTEELQAYKYGCAFIQFWFVSARLQRAAGRANTSRRCERRRSWWVRFRGITQPNSHSCAADMIYKNMLSASHCTLCVNIIQGRAASIRRPDDKNLASFTEYRPMRRTFKRSSIHLKAIYVSTHANNTLDVDSWRMLHKRSLKANQATGDLSATNELFTTWQIRTEIHSERHEKRGLEKSCKNTKHKELL